MTTIYYVTVDGRTFPMVSLSGKTYDEAVEYARGIFGDRLQRVYQQ